MLQINYLTFLELGDFKNRLLLFSEVSGKDAFEGRSRLKDWYNRVIPALEPHFNPIHRIVHKHAETTLAKP